MTANAKISAKICLLGQSGVGKSSIIKRARYDHFNTRPLFDAAISLITHIERQRTTLQLWNIDEDVKDINKKTPNLFKGTDCFIIAFDIHTKNYLDNIKRQVALIKKTTGLNTNSIVLMRTKIDLDNPNEKELEKIQTFVAENKYTYFEVSAKKDIGINKAFDSISDLPTIAHKEALSILHDEIQRLSGIESLFDKTHQHKREQFEILYQMLSQRADKPINDLIEEWGNETITVTNYGFDKTIKRIKLIETHRDWFPWLTNNKEKTDSMKVLNRLRE